MQTVDEYLASEGALSLSKLAEALSISKGRLSQLRHSNDWPPDLALKCEEALGGAVSASALSPTVKRARDTAESREQAA